MRVYIFLWRTEPGSDFFEQGYVATTLEKAKSRWRYYTGLRIRDMVYFEHIATD